MGRRILAILAGSATGLIIIYLIRMIITVYYSFPADMDWESKADRAVYISSLPDTAFVLMVASHMVGAFLAGLISALVSRKDRLTNGSIAAIIIFIIVTVDNFTHSYPEYYLMIDTLATAVAGFAGAMFGRSRSV